MHPSFPGTCFVSFGFPMHELSMLSCSTRSKGGYAGGEWGHQALNRASTNGLQTKDISIRTKPHGCKLLSLLSESSLDQAGLLMQS